MRFVKLHGEKVVILEMKPDTSTVFSRSSAKASIAPDPFSDQAVHSKEMQPNDQMSYACDCGSPNWHSGGS